jgi:hypothetical protein
MVDTFGMTDLTTIKVPKALRRRLAEQAEKARVTAAGMITALLDEHERRARFRAVGEAYAREDDSYLDELDEWAASTGDVVA